MDTNARGSPDVRRRRCASPSWGTPSGSSSCASRACRSPGDITQASRAWEEPGGGGGVAAAAARPPGRRVRLLHGARRRRHRPPPGAGADPRGVRVLAARRDEPQRRAVTFTRRQRRADDHALHAEADAARRRPAAVEELEASTPSTSPAVRPGRSEKRAGPRSSSPPRASCRRSARRASCSTPWSAARTICRCIPAGDARPGAAPRRGDTRHAGRRLARRREQGTYAPASPRGRSSTRTAPATASPPA